MSDLQHSVKQRFDARLLIQLIFLNLIFLFIIVVFNACDADPYQKPGQITKGRYIYRLRISTTEAYSQIVELHDAQILVNGKEQSRIAFIAGTRIIEVPFQYIQSIRFSNVSSTNLYSNMNQQRGTNRIRMEIFAEGENGQPNGYSIACDSIPDFYVVGQESRYVKRIFRNNTERFDMQEIQILQITDRTAPPPSQIQESNDPRIP